MPFSWVRVSSGTGTKIRACTKGDPSKERFAECVYSIVEEGGGRVGSLWFEQNGKHARVRFWWDTHQQKMNIVFDLEGEEVIDLISVEEAETLLRDRGVED